MKELQDLFALENSGFLKIYFADESGFNLTPNIPYGWQKKNETISIPSQRSATINVFGLLARDNSFVPYETMGSINSDLLIAFIDNFSKTIKEKTCIIMDNAPIHKSNKFKESMERWKKQDLDIWFLPTYSPHLNIIEILWKKMKYEWLKPKDYNSIETLMNAVDNILINFGEKFCINFKDAKVSMINYINSQVSLI